MGAETNEFIAALVADPAFLKGLGVALAGGELGALLKADTVSTATGLNWYEKYTMMPFSRAYCFT